MNNNSPPTAAATPRGFTLLELLVVISIIALLIAILFPVLGGARSAARKTSTEALMRDVMTAVENFRIQKGRLPGVFSQRELASMANQFPGFTPMENALLDLAGGVVDPSEITGSPNPASLDNPYIRVGPTTTVADQVLVDTLRIGDPTGPGYLQFKAENLFPIQGQATNQDIPDADGVTVAKGMPDIIDAFGQPLMLWVEDGGAPEKVTEVEDFARVEYATSLRARFYVNANRGYLDATKLGEDQINQLCQSSLGGAVDDPLTVDDCMLDAAARVANLTAVLGSPAFPVQPAIASETPSLPAQPRGKTVLISAGKDRAFFKRKELDAKLGYGPDGAIPGMPTERAPTVDDFDDLIQSSGG